VPLSFAEAAVGAEIDVPVLDGIVRMRVPPGTQAGTQFRLRGKGFPRAGGRGDAHVRIFVETPASLSGDAQAALEKLMPLVTEDAMPRRQAFRAVARARVAKSSTGVGTGGASSAEGGS
jgi:molecular chaperone DnaJ